MDKENKSSTECKFYDPETTQGILHELCRNLKMLKAIKPNNGEKIKCIGSACGNWEHKE